ncbi:MAG: LysR substrate-binding domain-containing protein [Alphaproteobacteria bacterium]
MDRLAAMSVFRKVVDAEGFAAAARALGLSNAAVSKQVKVLEDHLGTRLLQRTTRQISLTDAGRVYYDRCVALLDGIEAAECAVRDLAADPKGTLRLNAPMDFGLLHLSAVLTDFAEQHPRIRLDVCLSDRFVDPIAEGFDLTIRLSPEFADSSLVQHHLGTDLLHLVASPDYLEAEGVPRSVTELADRSLLAYALPSPAPLWRLRPPGADEPIALRVEPRLQADNGMMLAEAARCGLGIALLPRFIVGPDIEAGRLAAVLPDHDAGVLTIAAMSAPGRQVSGALRLLIDHIRQSLRTLRGGP